MHRRSNVVGVSPRAPSSPAASAHDAPGDQADAGNRRCEGSGRPNLAHECQPAAPASPRADRAPRHATPPSRCHPATGRHRHPPHRPLPRPPRATVRTQAAVPPRRRGRHARGGSRKGHDLHHPHPRRWLGDVLRRRRGRPSGRPASPAPVTLPNVADRTDPFEYPAPVRQRTQFRRRQRHGPPPRRTSPSTARRWFIPTSVSIVESGTRAAVSATSNSPVNKRDHQRRAAFAVACHGYQPVKTARRHVERRRDVADSSSSGGAPSSPGARRRQASSDHAKRHLDADAPDSED